MLKSYHSIRLFLLLSCLLAASLVTSVSAQEASTLQVGVAKVDVTPVKFPSICGGTMVETWYDKVSDPLSVRCFVFADNNLTIAMAIVDSNMIPRSVCDQAKKLAHEKTGIPVDRILISATHTHAAPSVMNFALGLRADEDYAKMLVIKIAAGIAKAHAAMKPAKVGWTAFEALAYTSHRRWVRESQKYQTDPFGEITARANLGGGEHRSGPVDEQLSLLSFVSVEGDAPIALLANFSMHYFSYKLGAFSADYFGLFSDILAERIVAGEKRDSSFLVAMSQGTSGDCGRPHFVASSKENAMQEYSAKLANLALSAYRKIEYQTDIPLAMIESKQRFTRRMPSKKRLAWADEINRVRGDRRPRNKTEVYAEQARWIQRNPSEELVFQVVRIGDLAITAFPNEAYGITGLKLKAQSPFEATFNMTLANGAAGYIPPPEQHYLGGYTTWPARTAGLEVNAEPKIVNTLLGMLEKISDGKKRKALDTDFYTDQQRESLKAAKEANNNAENRGANSE